MSMSKNEGIIVDPLFVGPTRPTTIGGVTLSAFMLNMIIVVEFFVITRNLLWLALFIPVHGIFYLICANDPRTFDLMTMWIQTKGANFRGLNIYGNKRFWKSSSYSPLEMGVQLKNNFSFRKARKETA